MNDKLTELLNSPFFLLFMLIAVFYGCMQVKAHFKNQLINPTLITTIVVIILLKALNVRWVSFEQASHHLSFWLLLWHLPYHFMFSGKKYAHSGFLSSSHKY